MTTKRTELLDSLIANCECIIRRGDFQDPQTLHVLQRYLVRARDAADPTDTERKLQRALEFYEESIPEDYRRNRLDTLTTKFARVSDQLESDEGRDYTTAPEGASSRELKS